MSEKEIEIADVMFTINRLAENYFDVVHDLRQIARIPDTDDLRDYAFETRKLATDALFRLGAATQKQIEEERLRKETEETPTDAAEDKKVYYEIRLGVYSNAFNVDRDWMWNSGASGRCEMCGPIHGTGDHREFGHYTMRCPVEKDFFESVLRLFEKDSSNKGRIEK